MWGFNDVVVVERDCQTCVNDEVIELMNTIGIIILIVGAISLVLIVLLILFIKIEEWKKKQEFMEKLGSSSGNLPDKAINRVLESLRKYRENKEAEEKKFNADYERTMKLGTTKNRGSNVRSSKWE